MRYKLERTDDKAKVQALHTLCMPEDSYDLSGQLWICHDETGTPVAFCSAREVVEEDCVFLSRSGVLPLANGNRLQRRMIQARVQWAKEVGATMCITYVKYDNHASIVNLLRSGFRLYFPQWRYGGDVHYFKRKL